MTFNLTAADQDGGSCVSSVTFSFANDEPVISSTYELTATSLKLAKGDLTATISDCDKLYYFVNNSLFQNQSEVSVMIHQNGTVAVLALPDAENKKYEIPYFVKDDFGMSFSHSF